MTLQPGDPIVYAVDVDKPEVFVTTFLGTLDNYWAKVSTPDAAPSMALCFPVAVREELVAILTERQRLKKAYEDSISLIYDLGNRSRQ